MLSKHFFDKDDNNDDQVIGWVSQKDSHKSSYFSQEGFSIVGNILLLYYKFWGKGKLES